LEYSSRQYIANTTFFSDLGKSYRNLLIAMFVAIIMLLMAIVPAYASSYYDIPDQVRVSDNRSFTPVNYYPPIFGSKENANNDVGAFTKWTGVFERMGASINSSNSTSVVEEWKENLSKYKGLGLLDMVREVNDYINQHEYVLDSELFGMNDYWATPIEFFTRGGDCEDFAIAKYASLRALGVPNDRIRILVLKDTSKNEHHVVLVVYTDQGPMMLDNQIKDVRPADNITHYVPVFSLNSDRWWVHNAQ
jgi:predicted transglutaminase-like cysteine proteinase